MAKLYYELCFYAKAEPLYQRALAIQEKTLGPGHSSTAALLNNLAQLYYYDNQQYGRAEPLQRRALAIREKTLGPRHPATATCLDNLSAIYSAQGRFREAEPLCTRALAIREKTLGSMHPYTARTLVNLAALREMQNRPAEALGLMKRALAIQDAAIDKVFSISSENEKFGFLFFYDISDSYNSFLNLVTETMKNDPEARRAGLDAVLRRKGLVVDALSRERDSLARSETSPVKSKLQELERVTSLITSLTLAGQGSSTPEGYQERLNELETTREKLDRELALQSSEYTAGRSSRYADSGSIAHKLPPGSALVEYISIPFLAPSMQGAPRKRGDNHYYAFVIHSSRDKDSRAVPELMELGSASVIDGAVKDFHRQIHAAECMWESQVLDEGSAEKQVNEKGRALYHLVVAPLRKALGERTTLFVAPDGALNLVPFGALQDEKNHYMLENYEINYLSCGRDLLRFRAGQASGGPTVIFANPDFTMTLSGKSPRELDREVRGLTDLGSFIWSPLPGTGKEAENITKILTHEPVILFSGKNALKSKMIKLSAPRRLHIATHGFFLKRREDPEDPPAGKGKALLAGDQRLAPPLRFENLLLRSGLVFAGAHSPGPEKFSQGIMTALEVSTLNLRGTDLVVLSACETGSGTSLPGEGVFGLRRSFQLAGARTVVMSLWSVPDEETQQLMTLFYRNLKGGEGKSAALRNAALAMIKERREKHGAAHPFFWAPFISVGE